MGDNIVHALLICAEDDRGGSNAIGRLVADLSSAFAQDDPVVVRLAAFAISEGNDDHAQDETRSALADHQVLIPVVTPRFLRSVNCWSALRDFYAGSWERSLAIVPLLSDMPDEPDWGQAELAFMAPVPTISIGELWKADSDNLTWGDLVQSIKKVVVATAISTKKQGAHDQVSNISSLKVERDGSSGMFKLDHQFLVRLGLGWLPPKDEQDFLQRIYSELEMRVGEKLTDGMSDAMLDEFGYFVDMNEAGMATWFAENVPDYESRDDFIALRKANPDAPDAAVKSEFGAMKWLQINRPDHPQVTAGTLKAIQQQLEASSDAIVAEYEEYPE